MREYSSRYNKSIFTLSDMELWSLINTIYIAIESYTKSIRYYESIATEDKELDNQIRENKKYLMDFNKLQLLLNQVYQEAYILNTQVHARSYNKGNGEKKAIFKTDVNFNVNISLSKHQINAALKAVSHVKNKYNVNEDNALDERSSVFSKYLDALYDKFKECGSSQKLYLCK